MPKLLKIGPELHFDADRLAPSLAAVADQSDDPFDDIESPTGIFIRAKDPESGRFKTGDIYYLTSESLLAWLRSRDGNNPWAENTVGMLLGHGPLHKADQ
jgi:hypothetical protein